MLNNFLEISKYFELLYTITWREIIIKYKQSVMGFMWAIFMPILIVAAGILVKYAFAMLSNKPLSTEAIFSVTVKALPWSLFVSSIKFSSNSLIANANLVAKINCPRIIFPLSSVISQIFDFLIASIVLLILFFFSPLKLTVYILWLPLLLLVFILLITGLGILFSAANLFFRDVKYIVEVILTFAIFFTPVFYEVDLFPQWSSILLLNPVAPIFEAINSCVVLGKLPALGWVLYSSFFSLCCLIFAIFIFKKLEPYFAESR